VRRRLEENELKPWRKDMWCIPQIDGEFVARMEDVLDLYAEEPDRKRPVVCLDESPTQLIGEVRQPIEAKPGQLERYDCEYKRNGTANLFIFLDVHRPGARSKSPTAAPPSTSPPARGNSLMFTFPRQSAFASRWIICPPTRLGHSIKPSRPPKPDACWEFHYVPKHASWLNMVETEIGVLCAVNAWIGASTARNAWYPKIDAWERQRNASCARIKWMFTAEKARTKMGRAYPEPSTKESKITVTRY
jgi:hypothetical protein